jgi:cytochrome b6-f complex iron-sulfur subunit
MENTGRERRKLLKGLAGAGALSLFLWRYLIPPSPSQQKPLLQIRKDELPAKGALVYREARIAVLQDAGEIYALSLVCTHLGCTVKVTANEIICPCHGSVFDRTGRVLKGPAGKDLKRLTMEERGESLVVMI